MGRGRHEDEMRVKIDQLFFNSKSASLKIHVWEVVLLGPEIGRGSRSRPPKFRDENRTRASYFRSSHGALLGVNN